MQERPSTTWVIALSLLLVGAWAGCAREMRTAKQRAEVREVELDILRRAGVSPDSVRNEELIALLEIEARATPDDLIKSHAKASVVYLLAERGAEEAIPAMRRYLKRLDTNRERYGSSEMKLDVCEALHKLGDDDEAWIPTCVSLLKSEHWLVRIRAARFLAWVGDARGWPVIEGDLTDANRSHAVTAQAIAPLFDGLELRSDSGTEEIRVARTCIDIYKRYPEQHGMLEAIVKTARKDDLPALRAIVAGTKDDPYEGWPYPRRRIRAAIARLERGQMLEWVIPALGLVAAAALGAAGVWLVRRRRLRRKSAEGG